MTEKELDWPREAAFCYRDNSESASEVSDKGNITHDVGWFVGTARADPGRFTCEADCEGPTEERSEPGGRSGSGRRFCGETVKAYCDQEGDGRRRHESKEEHSERMKETGLKETCEGRDACACATHEARTRTTRPLTGATGLPRLR